MNRRRFIGATVGSVAAAALACPRCEQGTPVPRPVLTAKGPFSIEIVSPPQDAGRELPLFDTYKQAENFAIARMNIMRMSDINGVDNTYNVPHEAGRIKVWNADSEVVFEASWGETWSMTMSYVDVTGRRC